MVTASKEYLLTAWDNRPSAFFCPDDATRINKEIAILEALHEIGCNETRDGLSVDRQLDMLRGQLRSLNGQ